MRVLASTARTQGQRPDDISAAGEGEFVMFPTRTGRCPVNCPTCGCTSAMIGFSGYITTTFTVVEVAHLDAGAYADLFFSILARNQVDDELDLDRAMPRRIRELADEHLEVAARHPVGVVLELRKGTVHERAAAMTAMP